MTILETRTLTWPDEAACAATAGQLALQPGLRQALLTLDGALGAGKTTFTRHLLRALGVTGPIKSPTYAVVEEYAPPGGGLPIWHFDFYRFKDPQEWEDAGFRDIFATAGLKLAEWPEQADALLPRADVAIFIAQGDGDERTVRMDALSPLGQALLP